VVLFRLASDESAPSARNHAGYEAVAVMLDLAITLANADGKISGREVQFLNRQLGRAGVARFR
jgi:tellurite resistance protein